MTRKQQVDRSEWTCGHCGVSRRRAVWERISDECGRPSVVDVGGPNSLRFACPRCYKEEK